MVLGRIHDELDFEARVFGEYIASGDDDEFDERLEAIGTQLALARVAHLDSRARNDDLADAA